MKIKKSCSLSSSKEDEKKIDDRWIEDASKDYENMNYRLVNLIRELKMEDAITCTSLNNIPSPNRRITFSDANTNLTYYFIEIQYEKGDKTFAVS